MNLLKLSGTVFSIFILVFPFKAQSDDQSEGIPLLKEKPEYTLQFKWDLRKYINLGKQILFNRQLVLNGLSNFQYRITYSHIFFQKDLDMKYSNPARRKKEIINDFQTQQQSIKMIFDAVPLTIRIFQIFGKC